MAMTLGAAKTFVKNKMVELYGTPDDDASAEKAAELIACLVVYIQNNAEVTVPATPATVGVD